MYDANIDREHVVCLQHVLPAGSNTWLDVTDEYLAFYGVTAIKTLILPSTLENLYCLKYNPNLEKITIPEGCYVQDYAFQGSSQACPHAGGWEHSYEYANRHYCKWCSASNEEEYTEECLFGDDSTCDICGYECDHNWNGDNAMENAESRCEICGKLCEHQWSYGYCEKCCKQCEHPHWTNGYCDICGEECNYGYHSWENGICSNCGLRCEHQWSYGYCEKCGVECSHSYNNSGYCEICGVYNSSYDDTSSESGGSCY